jgi:hypothetical protein
MLAAEGLTREAIAAQLSVSVRSVYRVLGQAALGDRLLRSAPAKEQFCAGGVYANQRAFSCPPARARCCPASEPIARAGFFAQADRGRLADTGRRRCVGRSDRCAGEDSFWQRKRASGRPFSASMGTPVCASR